MVWCTWHASALEAKVDTLVVELKTLGKLGTKIGQYLCNRPGYCTYPMKRALSVFLNDNTVHDHAHTWRVLRDAKLDHRVTLGDVIGSGTFAQVYRCTLDADPHPLALKVNHPLDDIWYDLYVVRALLWCASWMVRVLQHIDVKEWLDSMYAQMDMTHEIQHMKRYHHIYQSFPAIRIPACVMGGSNFILMTYEEGTPLNRIPRKDTLYKNAHRLVMASFIHTGFVYDMMHGDIHEGNILVREQGITLLDFGLCIPLSMKRLTEVLSIPYPRPGDMKKLLDVILHPSSCDRTHLCRDLCEQYHQLFLTSYAPRFSDMFAVITRLVDTHKFMIRGTIMTYMMNVMLLEDLSPYRGNSDQTSSLLAMIYMRTVPFFQQECGHELDAYCNTLTRYITTAL